MGCDLKFIISGLLSKQNSEVQTSLCEQLKEVQLVVAKMLSSSSLALQGVCTVYAFTQHFLRQFPFPLFGGLKAAYSTMKTTRFPVPKIPQLLLLLGNDSSSQKKKRTGCKKCGSEKALGQKVVCHIAKAQRRRKKWEEHQRWEKPMK